MSGGPNGDPNISAEDGIIEDEDDFDDEEYAAVNSMLDQINSYLDDIEERNDALNGKLHELLESNRQARLEFRAQLNGSTLPDTSSSSPLQENSSVPLHDTDQSSEPQSNDKDNAD